MKEIEEAKLRLLGVSFDLIPDYADLFKIRDFNDACTAGIFIDSDGIGYYALKDKESDLPCTPSDFINNKYNKLFTHITWYNK